MLLPSWQSVKVDSRGVTALEYGLLAGLIAVVIIGAGLFNAQYMTRMARIALMPPKAMRCRPSETL